jgi:hypothetical protein
VDLADIFGIFNTNLQGRDEKIWQHFIWELGKQRQYKEKGIQEIWADGLGHRNNCSY